MIVPLRPGSIKPQSPHAYATVLYHVASPSASTAPRRGASPSVLGRDGDRETVIARYRDDHLPGNASLLARLGELVARRSGAGARRRHATRTRSSRRGSAAADRQRVWRAAGRTGDFTPGTERLAWQPVVRAPRWARSDGGAATVEVIHEQGQNVQGQEALDRITLRAYVGPEPMEHSVPTEHSGIVA